MSPLGEKGPCDPGLDESPTNEGVIGRTNLAEDAVAPIHDRQNVEPSSAKAVERVRPLLLSSCGDDDVAGRHVR
jgi:hypothetical protein